MQDIINLRNAAKKRIERKIIDAYDKYDIQKSIKSIEARVLADMEVVTDKLLGIDRRWSDIDIIDGKLRQIIDPEITRILTEQVKPLMDAEIARVLALKSIQTAVKKAVTSRIKNAIYNIEHYNNDLGKDIDRVVQSEISKVFTDWTSAIAEDTEN